MEFIVKDGYSSKLGLLETQVAIKELKDFFQITLAKKLNLTRVSAPLFVIGETGLNDNLNGVEKPVSFNACGYDNVQIVHSLAKWKRYALKKYEFELYTGLYTDMNAIRKEEDISNIHSIYVDQWDWEKIIDKLDRCDKMLEDTVKLIFETMKETEAFINKIYPHLNNKLPNDIKFITSEQLLKLYPNLTPKQREYEITKKYGAVFIKQIGKVLSNGELHDGRAPDYDDWELNGDILFYNHVLDNALELSSMGIRVCEESLIKQLKINDEMHRLNFLFHKDIISKNLPYTIGGGIGQSRICMYFLEKLHIGEVQSSIWPVEVLEKCEELNIKLL